MATLEAAREELGTKLRSALQSALGTREPVAPLILVTAPGGVGKSRMVAHLLRHKQVTWFGERIADLKRLTNFLERPLPNLRPIGPVRLLTIEKRPSREDELNGVPVCSQMARYTSVKAAGLARFAQRLACERCPDYQTCSYQNWAPSKRWLFAPAVWLRLAIPTAGLFEKAEIVVIDESPASQLLTGLVITPDDLREITRVLKARPGSQGLALVHRALLSLLLTCEDLLAHPPDGRVRLSLRELAADLGYAFVLGVGAGQGKAANKAHARVITKAPSPLMRVDPSAMRDLLAQYRYPPRVADKLLNLADALAADTGPRPSCVLTLPSQDHSGGLVLGRRGPDIVPPALPLVVLDATGDTTFYQALFPGRKITEVTVDLEPQAEVIQIVDGRYPSSSLANPATVKKLLAVVDGFPKQNRAIVLKEKAYWTNPTLKNEVDRRFTPDRIGFYWSLRGKNSFKSVETLFVLGAPEHRHQEIEAKARALVAHLPIKAGDAPFDYAVIPEKGDRSGWVRVKDKAGSTFQLPERGYRHFAELLYWALHQAEYIQAAFRIRPFVAAKEGKKRIVILTNIYLSPHYLGAIEYRSIQTLPGSAKATKLRVLLTSALKILNANTNSRMSQNDLAKQLGIGRGTLSKNLKAARGLPGTQGLAAKVSDLLR